MNQNLQKPISSILDAIGNTPLLDMGGGLYAKAEFQNPSGSIKARMAKFMIEKAESQGLLKPGDTIVESTSGNTGNAMAMVAAAKGYKMIVVMPDGYSSERTRISNGFGAEIRFVGHFKVNEARDEAIRLGEQDGYYCPQQFDNEWNVEENREWLGREIIEQLPDGLKIDAIVQGVGTGGTLIGTVQALRQWHNPDLKGFAMEPSESQILQCCIAAEHKIEGIADGFVPTIYERHADEIDGIIPIQSDAAIEEAKRLCALGLFVGPSSGANVLAARELQKRDPEIKNIVTFLCDSAGKYLSMMFP
ncbi:MAG: cysteine synthase family protein [Alphaproteobacteria bacterium]|nr:cysteine synthase family protein [Alphaproteobacteria bacterium]